jgi:hypothetical protein
MPKRDIRRDIREGLREIKAHKADSMECWTCKSNTGEKRISPSPTIFEGEYWLVEHAYPVNTK